MIPLFVVVVCGYPVFDDPFGTIRWLNTYYASADKLHAY